MRAQRACLRLLLALALLLSQQIAFAHAISHFASQPARSDQQLPDNKVCDQCIQGAQFGAALLDSGGAHSIFQAAASVSHPRPESVYQPLSLPPFASRAPPSFF
jgi:hypothetical protein